MSLANWLCLTPPDFPTTRSVCVVHTCVEKETRYSLIIAIGTPANEVDLYTPIARQVGLTTEMCT